MSGDETTDPAPCVIAVVWTPSDAACYSPRLTVYCRRAINLCYNEGHFKPCNVKVPIAINNLARDGTLEAVQCGPPFSPVEGARRRSTSESSASSCELRREP